MQPPTLLQLSVVQTLLSLHCWPGPETQVPPPQVSGVVQSLPSEQGRVLLAWTQPVTALQESVVQTWPSSQFWAAPGTQLPAAQASPLVQTLLSVQLPVCGVKTQPVAGSQVSVVHGLPSLQVIAAPGLQAEPAQTSPLVQALLSVHGRELAANTQPVAALQLSLVQALLSLQVVSAPGMHEPAEHASPTVQTFPSLHAAVLLVNTQPLVESHASEVHGLPSLQMAAAPLTHAPAAQASPTVHALPSEQPIVLLTWAQPPAALQESVVHGLPSSQLMAAPGMQPPPEHTSPLVHALLSEHASVLFVFTQPVAGEHASSVQRLPSLHVNSAPDWQLPPLHASPLVQALLSVQATVLLVWAQPPEVLQESLVHRLLSSQFSGLPAQCPAVQTSPPVHGSPSSQPPVFTTNLQDPAAHRSFVQGSPSSQAMGVPTHVALTQ